MISLPAAVDLHVAVEKIGDRISCTRNRSQAVEMTAVALEDVNIGGDADAS